MDDSIYNIQGIKISKDHIISINFEDINWDDIHHIAIDRLGIGIVKTGWDHNTTNLVYDNNKHEFYEEKVTREYLR